MDSTSPLIAPGDDEKIDPLPCECGYRKADQTSNRSPPHSRTLLTLLILIALLLTMVLGFLAFLLATRAGYGTAWVETDFAPARGSVRSQKVRFTGTAAFHPNGSAFRVLEPGQPQYVGERSPEIDQAWEALISGRYFYITEDEAKAAWGPSYPQYFHDQWGYAAGLDVLHTLHCINTIRLRLWPDNTVERSGHAFEEYHIEHCLDILRQTVQCHADLTPIPTRYVESMGRPFIDSDQTHVCRDFEEVRKWATDRYNGSLAVHPSGL